MAWSIRAAVAARHKAMGKRLEALRKKKGWSQEDAAHAVKVGSKTWGEWERGKRWPYESNWRKIGKVFDVDPDTIKGSPPAPLGLGESDPGQLDRIEAKLDQVLDGLSELREGWEPPGEIGRRAEGS